MAALLLPVVYVLTVGPERFYYESWGTWILSPTIYTRVAPSPLKEWLLRGFVNGQLLTAIAIAIPVIMLFGSNVLAVIAIACNSLATACCSLGLMGTLLGVYHVLQPLGLTYVGL